MNLQAAIVQHLQAQPNSNIQEIYQACAPADRLYVSNELRSLRVAGRVKAEQRTTTEGRFYNVYSLS
jgi:predicted transcriptional regulator